MPTLIFNHDHLQTKWKWPKDIINNKVILFYLLACTLVCICYVYVPWRMMRSQTARTESQQGREEKRVRNHGITKWTDETPTDSCREGGKTGGLIWHNWAKYSGLVALPISVKYSTVLHWILKQPLKQRLRDYKEINSLVSLNLWTMHLSLFIFNMFIIYLTIWQ